MGWGLGAGERLGTVGKHKWGDKGLGLGCLVPSWSLAGNAYWAIPSCSLLIGTSDPRDGHTPTATLAYVRAVSELPLLVTHAGPAQAREAHKVWRPENLK